MWGAPAGRRGTRRAPPFPSPLLTLGSRRGTRKPAQRLEPGGGCGGSEHSQGKSSRCHNDTKHPPLPLPPPSPAHVSLPFSPSSHAPPPLSGIQGSLCPPAVLPCSHGSVSPTYPPSLIPQSPPALSPPLLKCLQTPPPPPALFIAGGGLSHSKRDAPRVRSRPRLSARDGGITQSRHRAGELYAQVLCRRGAGIGGGG